MATQTSPHTPGPWTISADETYPGGVPNHVIYAGDMRDPEGRYPVARLLHDETRHADANARLIAAAPAMLEILRTVVLLMADNGSPMVKEARTLLARIEGGA